MFTDPTHLASSESFAPPAMQSVLQDLVSGVAEHFLAPQALSTVSAAMPEFEWSDAGFQFEMSTPIPAFEYTENIDLSQHIYEISDIQVSIVSTARSSPDIPELGSVLEGLLGGFNDELLVCKGDAVDELYLQHLEQFELTQLQNAGVLMQDFVVELEHNTYETVLAGVDSSLSVGAEQPAFEVIDSIDLSALDMGLAIVEDSSALYISQDSFDFEW